MRQHSSFPLLFALAACDSLDSSSSCGDVAPAVSVGACIVASAILDETPPGQGESSFVLDGQGTVSEAGIGPAPLDCFTEYRTAIGRTFQSSSPEVRDARWIRIDWQDGSEVVIGVAAANVAIALPPVGEAVAVDYHHRPGGFSPPDSHLAIRATAKLVFWLGDSGGVAGLDALSEIAFTQGAAVCTQHSDCITAWTLNDLEATSGGNTVSVPFGESARLGMFDVTDAAVQVQTGESTCADAFVAQATVLVTEHATP